MSQNHSLLTLPLLATAVLAACRFVTPSGTLTGLGGGAFGVTRSAAAVGDLVPTDVIGTAIVEAGDVIANGDLVQSDATGRAIPLVKAGVQSAVIAGGSAGALVVAGILPGDRLIAVTRLNRDATAANINIADLTAEFEISDDDEIDNAGGTDTTGDSLLVQWETEVAVRGRALSAAAAEGHKLEILLFQN